MLPYHINLCCDYLLNTYLSFNTSCCCWNWFKKCIESSLSCPLSTLQNSLHSISDPVLTMYEYIVWSLCWCFNDHILYCICIVGLSRPQRSGTVLVYLNLFGRLMSIIKFLRNLEIKLETMSVVNYMYLLCMIWRYRKSSCEHVLPEGMVSRDVTLQFFIGMYVYIINIM